MEDKQQPQQQVTNPELGFEPLFYILDKCNNTVLAAKKQDQYEVSGAYVMFQNNQWKIWPANFDNQDPAEFPTRFVITKDKNEAWLFAEMMSTCEPLTADWCLKTYPRAEDFPKY